MSPDNTFAPWLAAKVDFARELLFQIADDPRLASLRENFILKGGAAILLGYEGVRASRTDLDLGLVTRVEITDDLIEILLEDLVDWDARLDITQRQPVERFADGSVNVHLAFIHPERPGNPDRFKLQVNGRDGSVPPRLLEMVQPRALRTYDGHEFEFPIMAAEEIVVEKMLRLFNTKKPPRLDDLFDIGWLRNSQPLDDSLIADEFAKSLPLERDCAVRAEPIERLRAQNTAAAYSGKADYGRLSGDAAATIAGLGITVVLRCAKL